MDIVSAANSAFEIYRNMQEKCPMLGSMLTASVVYPFGDIVSQLITDRRIDWRKVRYTAALAPLYGIGIHGLMGSGELVGEHISDSPLAKAALGPNFLGNAFNTFFFVNNTVGERNDYRLEELVNNYKEMLKGSGGVWRNIKERYFANIPIREFVNSVIGTLTAWNVFQYVNYAYVSEEMRTSAALSAGVVWTSLLSLWSLRGRRKLVKNK